MRASARGDTVTRHLADRVLDDRAAVEEALGQAIGVAPRRVADEDDVQTRVTLVGDDEQAAGAGRIGWSSPLARALKGARVGDVRTVHLPAGTKEWEIVAIDYA